MKKTLFTSVVNNQILGVKIRTLKSEAGLNLQPLLNEDDQIPANPLADEK